MLVPKLVCLRIDDNILYKRESDCAFAIQLSVPFTDGLGLNQTVLRSLGSGRCHEICPSKETRSNDLTGDHATDHHVRSRHLGNLSPESKQNESEQDPGGQDQPSSYHEPLERGSVPPDRRRQAQLLQRPRCQDR